MKYYIDCTSAEIEMQKLHNATYNDPEDPLHPFLDSMKYVFRQGQITSKCGRNIIELQKVLDNIKMITKELPELDKVEQIMFSTVLQAILYGITRNVAVGAGGDSYEPQESFFDQMRAITEAENRIP